MADEIYYHSLDVVAPLGKPGRYRAIADRNENRGYVVDGRNRFHRFNFPGTKHSRVLRKHCQEDPELARLAGLTPESTLFPQEVTVAFRNLKPVAALVAVEWNPLPLTPRRVDLRLLCGDQEIELDRGLAERYARSALNPGELLKAQGDLRGWPELEAKQLNKLGPLGDLRTFNPRSPGKRLTSTELAALPAIEHDLDELMENLERRRLSDGDPVPDRERVVRSWMSWPRTTEAERKSWSEWMLNQSVRLYGERQAAETASQSSARPTPVVLDAGRRPGRRLSERWSALVANPPWRQTNRQSDR